MRVGRFAGVVALIVLIASLAGLWRVLMGNAEVHLSGETLLGYTHIHPPKPWHGFDIAILDVSVNSGKVQIKAHVSGHMIHTPVEVTGAPEYDANAHSMFFHVMETRLPREAARPMLSRFNAMLSPLATYIAQNLTDVIPVKRIKEETRGGDAVSHNGKIRARRWRRCCRGISPPPGGNRRHYSRALYASVRRGAPRLMASRKARHEALIAQSPSHGFFKLPKAARIYCALPW